jgi:flagellar biosynthesis chaperone FliJ
MKTPFDAATRWKKQSLDTLRRELAELLRAQEALELQIASWDAQLIAEQQHVSTEPLLNYAAFATRARTERTALEAHMVELELEVAQIQARITEAFEDFKSLDVAAERFRTDIKSRRAAAEMIALDEVALQRHIRQAANGD